MKPLLLLLTAAMVVGPSEALAEDAGAAPSSGEATEARSPGLVAGGVALILGGGAGATALLIAASQVESDSRAGSSMEFDCAFERVGLGLGGALLASGSLGGGIAMIVVGAKQVPKESDDEEIGSEAWLLPSAVHVGPTGASLTWSF